MALAQRIESLTKRHAQIEDLIRQEDARPVPDTARLHELKKEKLTLKDEITKLASEAEAAA